MSYSGLYVKIYFYSIIQFPSLPSDLLPCPSFVFVPAIGGATTWFSECRYHNIGSASRPCYERPCCPQARPTAFTWGWKRPRPSGPPLLPSPRRSVICISPDLREGVANLEAKRLLRSLVSPKSARRWFCVQTFSSHIRPDGWRPC